MKKTILIINHYAGSPEMGMEFRPYYFAKEWIKEGRNVHIIAANYSHLRWHNPIIEKDFEEQIIDGIHYHWVKTRQYDGNGIKRAETMFAFVLKIYVNAKNIVNWINPDVVITSSTYPLDTYAGQRIRAVSTKTIVLIHEIHDMWPITPIEIGGMSKRNPFIQVLQKAEDSFCKKSDYVVSLLPNAKGYLMEHGMNELKFVHIPNGIVENEWKNPAALDEKTQCEIKIIKQKYDRVVCFFGSHTVSYALDQIVEVIRKYNNTRVALLMVGGGNYKEKLIEKSKGACNIYFFNSISKKCIPTLLEQIDIVYIGALNNNMFRFGICMNKLFDAMMAGKPILYAVNAPNNYVEQYRCGVSVEAENVDALKNGLDSLLKLSNDELKNMGDAGKHAAMENFTTTILARKFGRLMDGETV